MGCHSEMPHDPAVRQRLREHMKKHNIDRNDERPDFPVGLVYREAIPVRGSVHLATGRIISRENINKLFKLRFVF